MKQGWIKRHFGWIRDDFNRMLGNLKRPEAWITIALVGGFGLIAWGMLRLALQSDNTLRSLHPAMAFCREQDNTSIGVMFFVTIFFGLCALSTVGEFFNYLEAKRHHAADTARKALISMLLTGTIAVALGIGALLFLEARCR